MRKSAWNSVRNSVWDFVWDSVDGLQEPIRQERRQG
jgi:hypothetical protein